MLLGTTTKEGERIAQSVGSALGGTSAEIGAAQKLAETATSPVTKNVAKALSERPGLQLGMSAPVAAASQYVYDETGNPIASMLVGGGVGALSGLRTTKRAAETVLHEDLVAESQNLFNKAKESGITFNKSGRWIYLRCKFRK